MMKLIPIILVFISLNSYAQSNYYITSQHGLNSDSVLTVVEDAQENLWVGTERGLNKIDQLGVVTQVSQLNGVRINELQYNSITGVWAATNAGLANISSGAFQLYNSSNSALTVDLVTDLAVTSSGKTWCVNDSILYELNSGTLSQYNLPASISGVFRKIIKLQSVGNDVYMWPGAPIMAYRIQSSQFDVIQSLHYGISFFEGYNYKNKNYFVHGNIIYEQKNDSTYFHDSISGMPDVEWAGFDQNTGEICLRNFESLVTYDLNSSSYTILNCNGFIYDNDFNYRRKKALFSAQKNRSVFPTFRGLKLEFYPKTDVNLQLKLGKFTYQFQRKELFSKDGYLDTLNTKLSLLYHQDINFFGNLQGQNKASVIPEHGYSASDWRMGPVSNGYFFKSYHEKFARPFYMSKQLVDDHLTNWSSSGYSIPNEILDWPANGNIYVGEAMNLAPFVDLNGNGTYEPAQGDYPEIPGDECLYAIYHEPELTNSNYGLGLEVHRFAYIIKDGSFENEHTVYSHYSVINRGSSVIDSLQFILNPDLDLSFPGHDAAAVDTAQNSFYLWNTKPKSIGGHLAPKVPFQFSSGFIALDHQLVSHSVKWANNFNQLENQQNGLHNDGSSNWDSVLMRNSAFQFAWDGDSAFYFNKDRTFGGDIWQSAFLNPLTLNAGEKLCYNFAFAFGMVNDTLDGLGALKKTKLRLDSAKQLWVASNNLSCLMPTLSEEEYKIELEMLVFPNPSNGTVTISATDYILEVVVYDSKGAKIQSVKGNAASIHFQINANSGLYLLSVKTEKEAVFKKLILSN